MSKNLTLKIIEIEGTEIKIPLEKLPKQSQVPEDVIHDLRVIIQQKNQHIEALIDYSSNLTDEVARLREALRKLIQ